MVFKANVGICNLDIGVARPDLVKVCTSPSQSTIDGHLAPRDRTLTVPRIVVELHLRLSVTSTVVPLGLQSLCKAFAVVGPNGDC